MALEEDKNLSPRKHITVQLLRCSAKNVKTKRLKRRQGHQHNINYPLYDGGASRAAASEWKMKNGGKNNFLDRALQKQDIITQAH